MFAMAITLWIISVIIELSIVSKVPVYTLIERYTLVAISFSFGLSILIGHLFGATGMIVMLAGMGSTGTTMVLYKYHFLEHFKAAASATKTTINQVRETVATIHRVVTAPARGVRRVHAFIARVRMSFATFTSRFHKA